MGESGRWWWWGPAFGKSNDISPRLSVLILHQRVGVSLGWQHAPHPLMAAHKVTFISSACVFSEAPSSIASSTVPSRDNPPPPLFFPFLAMSSTYYF